MVDPTAEHTGGCWRPTAAEHCCGLRDSDGTWRVPGLGSDAALDVRDAWHWNAAVVRANEERDAARADRDAVAETHAALLSQHRRVQRERDSALAEVASLRAQLAASDE